MSDTEKRLRDKIDHLNFKWSIEEDKEEKQRLFAEIAKWNTMLDELLAAKAKAEGKGK